MLSRREFVATGVGGVAGMGAGSWPLSTFSEEGIRRYLDFLGFATSTKAESRRSSMARSAAPALLAVVVTASLAPATPASGQERYTLDEVAFLSGCWAGTMGSSDLEEQWTAAGGGVMLGTTRFLGDGTVIDWEFGRIEEDERGVTLWPYPKGTLSEHGFPLVSARDGELVFENPAHDFPVRIVYALVDRDRLRIRVEGSAGRVIHAATERVPCPG